MAHCPRCGADNQGNRSSCWNCFSALVVPPPPVAKPTKPADATPPEPPVAPPQALPRSKAEVLRPSRAPEPVRREEPPVIPAPVAPPQPARIATPAPPKKQPSSQQVEHGFAVVDQSLLADRHNGNRSFAVIFVLVALLVGGMLAWYYSFQATPTFSSPAEVGQAYLTALTAGDTSAQQQLASEQSKGVLLPAWLVIVSQKATGSITSGNGQATLPIELRLAPAPGLDPVVEKQVTKALSRPCVISLVLLQEGTAWRVDQHALTKSLRRSLITANPKTKFPAWE